MLSIYSEIDKDRAVLTLQSIAKTIDELIAWNKNVHSVDDYYSTQTGIQLLAANCSGSLGKLPPMGYAVQDYDMTAPRRLESLRSMDTQNEYKTYLMISLLF